MRTPATKYIFVLGSVISGLGKGILSASLARILMAKGFSVTNIKIDPYINVDAGTLRPTEHGEVFVTDDGGEIDEDFGHYERFTGNNLPKRNNITTGQVYGKVIEKERKGGYLGKTVQLIPHITDEIISRIKEASEGKDFSIVELGGSVGDYEVLPFLAAITLLKEPKAILLLSYLPTPKHLGEMKTKPTQHAVMSARSYGIIPNFLVCRSEGEIDDVRREKLSTFTNISTDMIICVPDMDSVYKVPIVLESQLLGEKLLKLFSMEPENGDMKGWERLVGNCGKGKKVRVNIIGKYVKTGTFSLHDSYVSVIEAVNHAAVHLGVNPEIRVLDSSGFDEKDAEGVVIVPGGFGSSGVNGKMRAIKYAREKKVPFLGLCFGLQLAVVEFARDVCGLEGAHSTEIDLETPHPVIDVLPEQADIIKENNYGATMRLGSWPAMLREGTLVKSLYGQEKVEERHRHRYEVNPAYHEILEKNGLVLSGKSPDNKLVEFIEIRDHPFFVATQAHPELKSKFEEPHPLFLGLLKAGLGE
jgi:CTP synthase